MTTRGRAVAIGLHGQVTAGTVHETTVAISLMLDKPSLRGRRDTHAGLQQVWNWGEIIQDQLPGKEVAFIKHQKS